MLDTTILNYKKSISINPDYFEAHANLGNALRIKGDLNASIFHLQVSLKINPKSYESYTNLGLTYKKKGNYSSALKYTKSYKT